MSRIELVNLRKEYGNVVAVNSMDLTIEDGEFIVFVGPSGCGKTTTGRCILQLENQTDGITLFICGQFITLVNIKKERINQ